VSLSSAGDLLSQWRAYAGSLSGFALGLRSAYLREAAHPQGCYLAPCLYTALEQQDAIDEMIQEFREWMTTAPKWDTGWHGGGVATAMRVAVTLKNESFKEEREWRLISMPQMIDHLDFR